MSAIKDLAVNNDDEPEYAIERKNSATGAWEVVAGLTTVTVRLSATEGGAAIHADLSKTCSERGSLGIYYAVFEGDALNTHLNNATYLGKVVWEVFEYPTGNILTSRARVVRASRRPD